MVRLIAGAAMNLPFADPLEFEAMGQRGPTGVDVYSAAIARFPGDILAQLSCGLHVTQDNSVRVYGDKGWLHVPSPWQPTRETGTGRMFLHRPGDSPTEEIITTAPALPDYLYTLEADHVAAHIDKGEAPAMPMADSLGNMQTLDRWLAAIGQV